MYNMIYTTQNETTQTTNLNLANLFAEEKKNSPSLLPKFTAVCVDVLRSISLLISSIGSKFLCDNS